MNAELYATLRWRDGHTQEIRFARDVSAVWPGYHKDAPLGATGMWVGDHRRHRLIEEKAELDAIMAEADYIEWGDVP